jgi:hypothetical protein
MAFCSNCGNKLKSTDKFCGQCGQKLNKSSEQKNVDEGTLKLEKLSEEIDIKDDTSGHSDVLDYYNPEYKTSFVGKLSILGLFNWLIVLVFIELCIFTFFEFYLITHPGILIYTHFDGTYYYWPAGNLIVILNIIGSIFLCFFMFIEYRYFIFLLPLNALYFSWFYFNPSFFVKLINGESNQIQIQCYFLTIPIILSNLYFISLLYKSIYSLFKDNRNSLNNKLGDGAGIR